MKPFSQTCKPFLDHLAVCNGCTGKRKIKCCEFALECLVAEILSRKKLVTNTEDLLFYSLNSCDKHWYLPYRCNCTNNSNGADANTGPCESEEG
ncbi:MAG: hypothetical protein M0Z35_07175 [Desulfitobacterium hafniense]|nr:hypothetical protein [Desulfitobacterium hafniense]